MCINCARVCCGNYVGTERTPPPLANEKQTPTGTKKRLSLDSFKPYVTHTHTHTEHGAVHGSMKAAAAGGVVTLVRCNACACMPRRSVVPHANYA